MNRKIIKVGLIGLGRIGKTHALCYRALQASQKHAWQPHISAVLRSHPAQDEGFLNEIGSPPVTGSMEEFFNHELDVVDICTPNDTHEAYSRRACDAGLHVYCEKPLARHVDEARRMLDASQRANVLTHTAFVYRYMPAVLQLEQAVKDDLIGSPLHFRLHVYHSGYLDPRRQSSWRLRQAASGGGALADLGIHLIDMLHMVLGEAAWVQCETRTFITSRPTGDDSAQHIPVDVDDWAVCTLGMANGAAGTLEVSRMAAGMHNSLGFVISGKKSSLRMDANRLSQAMIFHQEADEWQPCYPEQRRADDGSLSRVYFEGAAGMEDYFFAAHLACIEDFLNCIHENRASALDFDTAIKNQQVLQAAYHSARHNGERVAL